MKKKFRSFKEARKFARSLKLITQEDWIKYTKSGKKPDNIPATPNNVYKNKGWVNTGDWLGTGRIANFKKQYRSFQEARKFARSLKLKSGIYWIEYSRSGKKPADIPTRARQTYKKEWKGMGDWLGTGTIATQQMQFRSFDEARKFVCLLKFNTVRQYKNWAKSNKKPADIPKTPNLVYKKEFNGWGDFLGTGTVATYNIQYRSFSESRKFVRSLKLSGTKEWLEYLKSGKKPDDIPAAPNVVYKNKGWKSVGDWLGTDSVHPSKKQYRSFSEALKEYQKLAKQYHLIGLSDWNRFARTHEKLLGDLRIPANPRSVYTKEKVWKRIKK